MSEYHDRWRNPHVDNAREEGIAEGERRARAAIVEWLRSMGHEMLPEAIERGDHLKQAPAAQPQRQDSVRDQLTDLLAAARRMGCYDAEDWIRARMERSE